MKKKSCETVIMGDFNSNSNGKSTNQQRLQSLTSKMGYRQLINKPTTDIGTTIDLWFTNTVNEILTGVIETFYSDHKIIWMALNNM